MNPIRLEKDPIVVEYYVGVIVTVNGKRVLDLCIDTNADFDNVDYLINRVENKREEIQKKTEAEEKLEEIKKKTDVTQSHGEVRR